MKESMKKFVTVCLILIVVGSVFIAMGIGFGGKLSFSVDFINGTVDTEGDRIFKGEEDLEEFSELIISDSIADIMVVADGDSYKIEYSVYDSRPNIVLEDGTLKVKEKSRSGVIWGFAFQTKKTYITVHVPADKELKSVKLKSDTGKITVNGLEAEELDIATHTGKVSLNHVINSALKITTDTGKIVVSDLEAEEGELETATGNISVENAEVTDFIARSDTGRIVLNQIAADTVKVKTDTGNVECNIDGNEKDYGMELSTDVGHIKIDGSKKSKNYVKETAKAKKISITTDTGNIKVNFK